MLCSKQYALQELRRVAMETHYHKPPTHVSWTLRAETHP